MGNNAALSGFRFGRDNSAYVIVFLISTFMHGMMVAGIMLFLAHFHIEKDRFPRIIELVSFPSVQKQAPSFTTPQRVARLPANRPAPSPEAQPLPQISAAPETSPAQFSVPAQEGPAQPNVQSANPANGPQGEKGNEIVEIGSIKALDNIDYVPLYNPKPAYPLIAIRAGIQGSVDVDLVINEFGRVEQFTVAKVEGHPDFANETAKVIGRWRFPPPRIDGKKVKIKYLYTVNFRLQ